MTKEGAALPIMFFFYFNFTLQYANRHGRIGATTTYVAAWGPTARGTPKGAVVFQI